METINKTMDLGNDHQSLLTSERGNCQPICALWQEYTVPQMKLFPQKNLNRIRIAFRGKYRFTGNADRVQRFKHHHRNAIRKTQSKEGILHDTKLDLFNKESFKSREPLDVY